MNWNGLERLFVRNVDGALNCASTSIGRGVAPIQLFRTAKLPYLSSVFIELKKNMPFLPLAEEMSINEWCCLTTRERYYEQSRMNRGINWSVLRVWRLPLSGRHTHSDEPVFWRPEKTQIQTSAYWQRTWQQFRRPARISKPIQRNSALNRSLWSTHDLNSVTLHIFMETYFVWRHSFWFVATSKFFVLLCVRKDCRAVWCCSSRWRPV